MRPVIGITMSFDKRDFIRPGAQHNFIRREYSEQIQAAGASPIFLDNTIDPKHAVELCDGIVISGGEDIHPVFYGDEAKHLKILEPAERTEWERSLIDACDRKNIRILGICYGLQLLNVHYGGTLLQDIAAETGSELDHGTSDVSALHGIEFEKDFLGYKAGDTVTSASRHHQAVKDIAPGFSSVARAEDGIIEGLEGYGHYGIQWHSESDSTAGRMYGTFIDIIKNGQKVRLNTLL